MDETKRSWMFHDLCCGKHIFSTSLFGDTPSSCKRKVFFQLEVYRVLFTWLNIAKDCLQPFRNSQCLYLWRATIVHRKPRSVVLLSTQQSAASHTLTSFWRWYCCILSTTPCHKLGAARFVNVIMAILQWIHCFKKRFVTSHKASIQISEFVNRCLSSSLPTEKEAIMLISVSVPRKTAIIQNIFVWRLCTLHIWYFSGNISLLNVF
jgi:hypothetical protein